MPTFNLIHFHGHIERNLEKLLLSIAEKKGVVLRGSRGRGKSEAVAFTGVVLGRFVACYDLHSASRVDKHSLQQTMAILRSTSDMVCFRMPSRRMQQTTNSELFQHLQNFCLQVMDVRSCLTVPSCCNKAI